MMLKDECMAYLQTLLPIGMDFYEFFCENASLIVELLRNEVINLCKMIRSYSGNILIGLRPSYLNILTMV